MDQATKQAILEMPRDAISRGALESISSAFSHLSRQIEGMLGPQAANRLQPIAQQLHQNLSDSFGERISFRAVFLGFGPKATKLREFVSIGEALLGPPAPLSKVKIETVLREFAYTLHNDVATMAYWESFQQRVAKHLSQRNDRIAPVIAYDGNKDPNTATSGFSVGPSVRGIIKHLTLTGKIPGTDVRFYYRAATFEQGVLVVQHPLEQMWLNPQGEGMIEGLIDALYDELAAAVDQLEATHSARDWEQVYAQQLQRAKVLLQGNAKYLPMQMRSYVRDKNFPQVSEIKIEHNEYTLLMRNTSGEYPSFLSQIYTGSMEGVAFTLPFEELDTQLQKQLAIAFERELDWLEEQVKQFAPKPNPSQQRVNFTKIFNYSYIQKPLPPETPESAK